MFGRRRDETLNERLAREAGLALEGAEEPRRRAAKRGRALDAVMSLPGRLPDLGGIHGPHRAREWDIVATLSAPGVAVDRIDFVALPEGDFVADDDLPDAALTAFAEAVEASVEPPYRAEAVRRDGDTWAVAARTTDVVELPASIEGDEIELAVNDGDRTVLVDGAPSHAPLRALEHLAESRHGSYVARATRLDERLWEVEVFPL
jgi:hypothetical protein